MDETQHPNRDLKLVTLENARDLGGYRTATGATTQWRRFVRTGDMNAVSGADQDALIAHGIGTVIDLRMRKEIEAAPNVFGESGKARLVLHDFWGDRFDDYRSPDRTAEPAKKLADLYRAGLKQNAFVVAEIMTTFAESGAPGFAFHCRSGKDRTGLIAALLLGLADVPAETICADFALTATYLKTEAINPIDGKRPGAWQRGSDPATMMMTLAHLDERYGGARGYLRWAGVNDATLDGVRARLLEP